MNEEKKPRALEDLRQHIAERQRREAEDPAAIAEQAELERKAWLATQDAEARAQEAREREELRRRIEATAPERLVNLGAPLRAVEAWRNGLRETPALLATRRMVAEGKTFCVLSGPPDGGKTVAAVAAMAVRLLEARDEDVPCLFVRAGEGARLGLFAARDRLLMDQMLTAGLLVLDDLGMEALTNGSPWRSLLDELIDARYGAKALTVLTTNLDGKMFRDRYGDRIADRIRDAGVLAACEEMKFRSGKTREAK